MKTTLKLLAPAAAIILMTIACGSSGTKSTREKIPVSKAKTGTDVPVNKASDTGFDFENYISGQLPKGWSQYFTGPGGTDWKVVDDHGNKVLAQLYSENPNGHFNIIVNDAIRMTDMTLTVRLKGVKGNHDQGGGFIWRFTDKENYYVVRANPLEDNVVLYKVENGKRTDLPLINKGRTYGVDVPPMGDSWHTLKLTVKGDLFTVYLDEKELFKVKDSTFLKAGKVGLWTKADAVTYFDDYTIGDIEEEKPNIVFILIDDLGWKDVGYAESKYYETPHIDRLAKKGIIFTNAYSSAANCAPTRASLLSGQYTPRHGVFTVGNPARGESKDRRLIPTENSRQISLDKITIAEALKPAGYVSAAIGKWHVGNSPKEQGFDVGLDKPDIGYNTGHFNGNGEYLTDRLTKEALEFISKNNDNPFFLYLAHHAVHTPIQAKKDITVKYNSKEPEECHNNPEYAAMIESVDQSVGEINELLIDLGLSENTILIFFSDNGGHGTYTCQKPLRGGKGMYYEGGIRVPMFAYWPEKIKPGTQCDDPIVSTDFYPTILELTRAKHPDNYLLDGKSIVPLLKGNKSMYRDAIYWHFPAYLEAYNGLKDDSRDRVFRTRPVSVIRKGDWKLLMFHEEWVLDGGRENIDRNNSVELYNLKNDVGERNNLVNIEPKKRDELLDQLIDWQNEIKAPIPTEANQDYVIPEDRKFSEKI